MADLINPFSAITAAVSKGDTPLELHKMIKRKDVDYKLQNFTTETANIGGSDITGVNNQYVDFAQWLPFAAKVRNISPDPKDYILVPTMVMPSDLPNRNGVGFPLKELVGWNEEYKCQGYKTARGARTHDMHVNTDPLESRGVIIDSYLRKLEGYGNNKIWKLVFLLAFDRTKDPELANKILTGERNTYSMGAYVGGYTCSVCDRDLGMCGHVSPTARNFHPVENNQLAYLHTKAPVFFETSSVEDPAYVSAITDVEHRIVDRSNILQST